MTDSTFAPTAYAPAKTYTPKSEANSQPVSEVLDPEFCTELQANAKAYDDTQENADNSKWATAKAVNEMWPEHKGQFTDKKEYYAECSRVSNLGLKKKRFSDSGETLRRWCEVQAIYGQFSYADKLLDSVSFDHLVKAKKLFGDGKVKSPIDALKHAVTMGYTADEMKEHFDPAQPPHPWELVQGRLAGLQNVKDYPFLKDPAKAKRCAELASEIAAIIRSEIEKEGKSAE